MHGWNLIYTSNKLTEYRGYIFDTNLYCRIRGNLTLSIGRGRGSSELTDSPIGLACFDKVSRKFGRFTKTDGQHAGGQWIEAAGMTSLIGLEQKTGSLQGFIGADSTGLIEQHNTVDIPKALGFASAATH
jgi:hypothetical protein